MPAPALTLTLATRKSPLALAQAEQVAAHLRATFAAPGTDIEIRLLKITTTGDQRATWSLEKQGGKGLFTRELEQALLNGDADLAVHSCKDLPGDQPDGLTIAGYLPREDPRDVLILREDLPPPPPPANASDAIPRTIATSSPRRRQQIAMLFPDAQFTEIRGNVDPRLNKLAGRHANPDTSNPSSLPPPPPPPVADATLLAAAGLRRLGITGWPGLTFHPLGFEHMVPAVGQAAIALQCRSADAPRFAPHLDARTARAVTLERAFQTALGGGCQTALGVHAGDDTLWFYHEEIGLRSLPLSPADFADPNGTARRILTHFGFFKQNH
ncbi:hydroxymethylbilane synthase [Geminisphaera colitermitum]|uniref:hydroxymethylbilane synthase n=1 Tax=Geminisphaera colitermitum TaxID=1148786 RepID=UPI0005B95C11|nr:hydroxymethylbilane synthase [Geminisphaera colitermitum]